MEEITRRKKAERELAQSELINGSLREELKKRNRGYCLECDERYNRETFAREEALRANAAGKVPAKRTQTYVISSDDEDVPSAAARADLTETEDESANAAAGGAAPVDMPWPNGKKEETEATIAKGDLTCAGRFGKPGECPIPANIPGNYDAENKPQTYDCFLCGRVKRRKCTGGFAQKCTSTGCDFVRRPFLQAHKDAAAQKKGDKDAADDESDRCTNAQCKKKKYATEFGGGDNIPWSKLRTTYCACCWGAQVIRTNRARLGVLQSKLVECDNRNCRLRVENLDEDAMPCKQYKQ
jgi:hypothetical protein